MAMWPMSTYARAGPLTFEQLRELADRQCMIPVFDPGNAVWSDIVS